MKRFTTFAIATLAALVLAACSTPVPPGPPDDAIAITANLAFNSSLDTVTLIPGEEVVYRVNVPANVQSADLLYIELSRNLRLEVRPGGTEYPNVAFSSSSLAFFGSGLTGLAPTGSQAAFEGQTVTTPITCRGSCVLLDNAPSTFFVRVVNTGATTVNNVEVFVYGELYADETENVNDDPNTAPILAAFDGGAIETVGDVDFWFMPNLGTVAFDLTQDAIALEAWIVDQNGNPVATGAGPFQDGDQIQVLSGDYLRIWATNPSQAAASSRSGYNLEYLNPIYQGPKVR